jgi:hypothetical protein
MSLESSIPWVFNGISPSVQQSCQLDTVALHFSMYIFKHVLRIQKENLAIPITSYRFHRQPYHWTHSYTLKSSRDIL